MTNYSIIQFTNPAVTDIPPYSRAGFFFNDWEHLRQQHTGPIRLVTALNHKTNQTDARCAFFDQPEGIFSPQAAPFGSIEFSEYLPDPVLSAFIDSLEVNIKPTTGFSIRLTNYPHCYAPAQTERLIYQLLRKGYVLAASHQNAHLAVGHLPFEARLSPSKRRHLTKCRRAGLQFIEKPGLSADQVVDFVVCSRQQQGYTLTVPAQQLKRLLTQFPKQFRVFAVMAESNIAALTITVRVRNDILYNFLPADNATYRSFSPAVSLTAGLYAYCQANLIRILDLGVSLDADRQPKPGLIQFKRQLGAVESPKLTFEKRW